MVVRSDITGSIVVLIQSRVSDMLVPMVIMLLLLVVV